MPDKDYPQALCLQLGHSHTHRSVYDVCYLSIRNMCSYACVRLMPLCMRILSVRSSVVAVAVVMRASRCAAIVVCVCVIVTPWLGLHVKQCQLIKTPIQLSLGGGTSELLRSGRYYFIDTQNNIFHKT